jgi:hypothetical protein
MITINIPDNINSLSDADLAGLVRKIVFAHNQNGYLADEAFLNEFFAPKSQMFIERFCFRHHITTAELREMAEDCVFEWIATDKAVHQSYREASSHLTAHLRIKVKEYNNEKNRQPNRTNRDTAFAGYLQGKFANNLLPTDVEIGKQLPTTF